MKSTLLFVFGSSVWSKITSDVLPSRGGTGTPPGLPSDADLSVDAVYSSLCDHFVGFDPADNLSCARRCRGMFARQNNAPTPLELEAQALNLTKAEHIERLVKRGSRSLSSPTNTTTTQGDFPLLTVTNDQFDSFIQRLAPNCMFQSYLLDHAAPTAVDFCFNTYTFSQPELLVGLANKTEGATITKATSPANCQYLCQQDENCLVFNYDATDEETCILWPLQFARKYQLPTSTFIGDHPCKDVDSATTIEEKSICLRCDGKLTGSYDSKRFVTGTKYCTTQRQSLCELTVHPAPVNPFVTLKQGVKDSRKRTTKKYKWRHVGEDDWHSSDELIQNERE